MAVVRTVAQPQLLFGLPFTPKDGVTVLFGTLQRHQRRPSCPRIACSLQGLFGLRALQLPDAE